MQGQVALILSFLLALSSNNRGDELLVMHFDRFVAVDTILCSKKEQESGSIIEGYSHYPVCYIGDVKDTVYLDCNGFPSENIVENLRSELHLQTWTLAGQDLKIFVDTTQAFCENVLYSTYSVSEQSFIDTTQTLTTYPILIESTADSLIWIGYWGELGLLNRQFLAPNGEWINADTFVNTWCIGNYYMYLKPKQIVIAKYLKKSFGHKATHRLRFQFAGYVTYSNTFEDRVGEYTYLFNEAGK